MAQEAQDRIPGPDDTAAFQAYYRAPDIYRRPKPTRLYRLFVGWWRDR
jgi:hypothetical protein